MGQIPYDTVEGVGDFLELQGIGMGQDFDYSQDDRSQMEDGLYSLSDYSDQSVLDMSRPAAAEEMLDKPASPWYNPAPQPLIVVTPDEGEDPDAIEAMLGQEPGFIGPMPPWEGPAAIETMLGQSQPFIGPQPPWAGPGPSPAPRTDLEPAPEGDGGLASLALPIIAIAVIGGLLLLGNK